MISIKFIEILKFLTTPNPQPYTIDWLSQGQDLHISQQNLLSYGIKPFKDEVLCDVSPLEFQDVILGKHYMCKCHVIYDSRPHSVVVIFGGYIYKIP
jgi:hypothetical protein